MPLPVIHIWKKAPFLRLLFPCMAGIVLQWHLQTDIKILWAILVISLLTILGFFLIPFFEKYKLSAISGLAIISLFISVGGLLAWYKNIKHDEKWFGEKYASDDGLIITLLEDPVEKTKSYKANASVDYLVLRDSAIKTKGTIIVYFKKDSSVTKLEYGSQIIISKSLQEIKNSGNPGGFDYKRYSLFQGITHQVYLKENEFEILPGENKTRFNEFIFDSRKKVLNILRKNIKGEKELGLAEALLIGYKDDLDKTLVQSYSNTGVVHVIAISGLHLGLIYWLLLRATFLLTKRKNIKWLRPVLIIAGLWLFSFLAGAQPSIVRSAVMFTCIVGAEWMGRKSSIYNTLAFSAFLLLCYNPYWLWDVGFQLSYTAVLSIVIFMQPIYNWFYTKNKALDFIWKLNAVTLAAQILTLPVSIYHFHQFPNYFLFTNFVAVPLSSAILIGEIFLCLISFIPLVAAFAGKILSWLIWIMNTYVERIEMLPFALWDSLQISIPQAIFLLAAVGGFGYWLLEKNKIGWKYGFVALVIFVGLRSVSFVKVNNQQKLIVYNVPQKQAIDIIDGRNYLFVGDTDLLADDFVRNFHIKPARVLNRVVEGDVLKNYFQSGNMIQYRSKKILLVDNNSTFIVSKDKIPVDLLVVSKNPNLYFKKLAETFSIKQVVFDGSVPSWKMVYWKSDCDSLRIPYYDVSEKGAFVMNLR